MNTGTKDSRLQSSALRVVAAAVAAGMTAIVAFTAGPAFVPGRASAETTFVVNSAGDYPDTSPGNGVCGTGFKGECTLRAAIMEANAWPGGDHISFNISGTGPYTISVSTNGFGPLPDITERVVIDGAQAGLSSTPAVAIDGSLLASATADGLRFTQSAGESVVRGLRIARFPDNGIEAQSAYGLVIERNYIGVGFDGNADTGNRHSGIYLFAGSSGGFIRDNVISGQDRYDGIGIVDSSYTVVTGNKIGTNAAGTAAVPNGQPGLTLTGNGVRIAGSSSGTTIGGSAEGQGNLISGNARNGIEILPGSAATRVENNTIGKPLPAGGGRGAGIPSGIPTDETPPGSGSFTNPLQGNGQDGVRIDGSSDNVVNSNTIMDNGASGVFVGDLSGPAQRNSIRANAIYDNGLLGIDLSPVGSTAGANQLVNAPLVDDSAFDWVRTIVWFQFRGIPNTTYTFEWFVSDACDPSGFGEGKTFLRSSIRTTDGQGRVPFSEAEGMDGDLSTRFITATATDPAGTTSEFSNCVQVRSACFYDSTHPSQPNADGDFVDVTPPRPEGQDDLTWPNADARRDACDDDDDNDGLTDSAEAAGCNGTGATNPLVRDSDGDRYLDGAECALGTSSTAAASKPVLSSCGSAGDSDGDGLNDRLELCFYNTNKSVADTDGDLWSDRCEVTSLNGDKYTNAADLAIVSQVMANGIYHAGLDPNKDGVASAADLAMVAAGVGCTQLPRPPGKG